MTSIHPLPLILASTSKSRINLLKQAGLTFTTKDSKLDESIATEVSAAKRVASLAKMKATKVFEFTNQPALILAADTLIVFEKEILGKPKYKMDAVSQLTKLSDHTHMVITGWTVFNTYKSTWYEGVSQTEVTFRPLLHQHIIDYINEYPVTSWAGSYNAGLSSAVHFIAKVSGSYSGLQGLPLDQIMPVLIHEWAHPYKPRGEK